MAELPITATSGRKKIITIWTKINVPEEIYISILQYFYISICLYFNIFKQRFKY